MSIIMTALAVAGAQTAPAAAPAAQPVGHGQHQHMAQKQGAKGCCCCKGKAEGKKMACCEQHEKQVGDHTGHADNSAQ